MPAIASFLSLGFCLLASLIAPARAADSAANAPPAGMARVGSFFISQDSINEQLKLHSKSEMVKDMKVTLDPKSGNVTLTGTLHMPVEELRAINLDPALGIFRFQVQIKPEITPQGYLILDFPLAETYFYPAASKDPKHERIIIPVQLLSLGLASIRGYMAALSGDFSGFDRRTEKLEALVKNLDHSIATVKNADAKEDLVAQRDALKVQLEAIPIERKQLQTMSKQFAHILSFTGEKELNINNEIGARKNALILKLKLSKLAPFLKGVELGGSRIVFDQKDGGGENYLAIDINSTVEGTPEASRPGVTSVRPGLKTAPAIILRLNQTLFESDSVLEAEKKNMSSKIRDLAMAFNDDGLHITGEYHAFVVNLHFETTVDFVSTGTDVFEVRVRNLDVAGLDMEFLAKFILEATKLRLEKTLHGMCSFKYIGEEKDASRSLQVTVDTAAMVPAFPELHLVNVDVRDGAFLMKIGQPIAN